MTGHERETQQKDGSRDRLLDLALLAILFAGGLGVRWLYARAVSFPPLDDPAFYLTTAENLVSGRGLEVDVLWSYHTLYPSVTHPSHEVWMPLTTGVIAAAFLVAEHTLLTGQVPGLIMGAMLAPLTYLFGRRALPKKHSRAIASTAALLVALNATLSYQSASADSSAVFALLAAWALASSVRKPGDPGGYFGTGLLIGLAFLARAHGLLLLLAVPIGWWLLPEPQRPTVELPDTPEARFAWDHWPRESGSQEVQVRSLGPRFSQLLDLVFGIAIVATPWLIRNYLAFGTPLPGPGLEQAWLTDPVDAFNYLSRPSLDSFLTQPWQAILDLRAQALWHNVNVFLLGTFPWGILAIPGLWLLRRSWSFYPAVVYILLLFAVTGFLFPTASLTGMFYHSMGAVVPFVAVAAMYAVQRGAQRVGGKFGLTGPLFVAVTIGIIILAGMQIARSLPAVTQRHQAEKEQFEAIAAWLDEHAAPGDVIMTTQTYTLNYISGHPTIALPGNEALDAAWEAAQRYGARYLVITQVFGQYPQILQETRDPRFPLLAELEGTLVHGIRGTQP